MSTTTTSTAKAKRPRDSLVERDLRFSTDPRLQEAFVNSSGKIRLGMVLEELDTLAARVGYAHALGTPRVAQLEERRKEGLEVPTIVTAACDRIMLLNPISIDRDLKLRGMTTWVGKSSSEVRVEVSSVRKDPQGNDEATPHLVAYFVMVARRNGVNEAYPIPPLEPVSPVEKRHYDQGASNAARRKEAAATSLLIQPPKLDEIKIVHDMFARQMHQGQAQQDASEVPMASACHSSTQWTHPQNRNIHGNIFGGFLMRQAFELAHVTCGLFTGVMPTFLSMDDVSFLRPVHIGSVLALESQVVYTSTSTLDYESDQDRDQQSATGGAKQQQQGFPLVQVRVQANVGNFGTAFEPSNVFHFNFKAGANQRKVVPNAYSEAMAYLDGRRRMIREKTLRQDIASYLEGFGTADRKSVV